MSVSQIDVINWCDLGDVKAHTILNCLVAKPAKLQGITPQQVTSVATDQLASTCHHDVYNV